MRSILLFLLLFPFLLRAGVTDSLKAVLQTQKGEDRIQTLCDLSETLPLQEFDQALKYAQEAVDIAVASGDDALIIRANSALGGTYERKHMYPETIAAYKEALRVAERTNDKKRIGVACTNIGRNIFAYKSDLAEAMKYYLRAIEVYKQIDEKARLARTYVNVANAMSTQGDYEGALGYYQAALPYLKDSITVASVYNNIGATYFSKKDYRTALEWIKRAHEIKTRIPDILPEEIADSYNNIGNVSVMLGDTLTGRIYLEKALEINLQIADSQSIAMNYHNLGDLYLQRGMLDKAEAYLLLGERGAQRQKMINLQKESFSYLAQLYEQKGDFEKAFTYQKKYSDLNESQLKGDIKQQLSAAQDKFDAQQREQDRLKENEMLILKNDRKNFYIAMLVVGALGLLAAAFLLFWRFLEKKRANRLLENRNITIEAQKFEIEQKNKEITDSISYAQRLQEAVLPDTEKLAALFPHSFVLFMPKDIVSGDFFWCASQGGRSIAAVADCTGHGVPGALMSMIGNNLLHQAVHQQQLSDPAEILSYVNKSLHELLLQHETEEAQTRREALQSETDVKDGMDIALCVFDEGRREVRFAGANRPLLIVRNNQLIELAPDRTAIGGITSAAHRFTATTGTLQPGDCLYLFSDGYADQFGGSKGKKMMSRSLKDRLVELSSLPMSEQKKNLADHFLAWKGEYQQVDDVLLIGIRVV